MKVLIVGAGRIGRSLSKSLSEEDHEVYLIELREERVAKASEKLDVQVIPGNAVDPETLKKGHVEEADLVLAVTTSDETNLIVCSLAGCFGAKRRIARVRNVALSETLHQFGYDQFYINETINPELVAAQAILKMVEAPGSNAVADFADGKILLRAFDIDDHSPLCGTKMEEFRDEDFPWPFLIVSVVRNGQAIIPKGDTTVEVGDKIHVLLPAPSLPEFLTYVEPEVKLPQKIVIFGASIMGRYVGRALEHKFKKVVIIEDDLHKANDIADEISSATVINGSAVESEILNEAGIEVADVYVAASNNDQANIISSVLAKKLGAKSSIIATQQADYASIIDNLDIDGIVNPYILAIEHILHLVRGKGVSAVSKLLDGDAEALEFVTEEGAPITKSTLKDMKFPKNSIVGAVCREKGVELAKGDTKINAGDKVIVFCQEEAVKKVTQLFASK